MDLDLTKGPGTFIHQALDGLHEKLAEWKSNQIPTFGGPTGIVINYTPDHAVRFDLEGNAIEALDRAYRLGEASLSIGRRPVSSGELSAIFGQPTIINLKGYGNRRGITSGLMVDGSNTKSGSEIHRVTTPKSPKPKPLTKSQMQKRF